MPYPVGIVAPTQGAITGTRVVSREMLFAQLNPEAVHAPPEKKRHAAYPPGTKDKIIKLHVAGVARRLICEQLGVDKGVVAYHIQRFERLP
jgi:hypothetical protein